MRPTYILFSIILISILVSMPVFDAYSAAQLLKINEVEYNPPGPDDGNQWLELYNQEQNLLDLSGWLIKSTKNGRTFSVPDGFVILPNDYLVIPFGSTMFDLGSESAVLLTSDSVEVDRTPELNDAADDDLTWQRFPNGIDTDTPADWQFRNSTHGASNGFPVQRQNFTLSTPIFVDVKGDKVASVTAGQMAGVKSEIINQFSTERTFAYIVMISDEDGFTVFLSWVEDLIILPNRTLKPAVFWLAEEQGNYLVEVFVWRSMAIPDPLVSPESDVLRVAG